MFCILLITNRNISSFLSFYVVIHGVFIEHWQEHFIFNEEYGKGFIFDAHDIDVSQLYQPIEDGQASLLVPSFQLNLQEDL